MSRPRVIVVPGIMGTDLFADFWGWRRRVWLDYSAVVTGLLKFLTLATDGIHPASVLPVRGIITGGPVTSYYGQMESFLTNRGYQVIPFGYDWRRSVRAAGANLAALLTSLPPSDAPTYVLGHSMGGLVMRAAWKLMGETPPRAAVDRWVTLATPHYGTLQAARVFAHLDESYRGLWTLTYGTRAYGGSLVANDLDAILGSWPSVYELLPWASAGPYATEWTLLAKVRDPASYAGRNASFSPVWASAMSATENLLGGTYPADKWTSCYGVGLPTAYSLSSSADLRSERGYANTYDGDGRVWSASAVLAGAKLSRFVGVKHYEFPYHPAVLGALDGIFLGLEDSLPLLISRR